MGKNAWGEDTDVEPTEPFGWAAALQFKPREASGPFTFDPKSATLKNQYGFAIHPQDAQEKLQALRSILRDKAGDSWVSKGLKPDLDSLEKAMELYQAAHVKPIDAAEVAPQAAPQINWPGR